MADNKKSCEETVIWECIECGFEHEYHKNDYRQDGLRCRCCNSIVIKKPHQDKHKVSKAAFFIRERVLERKINYCRTLTPKQVDAVIQLYKEYTEHDSKSVGDLKVDLDVSDALTGLKAVQREARKATAALREFELQQTKMHYGVDLACEKDMTIINNYCKGCNRHEQYCVCKVIT